MVARLFAEAEDIAQENDERSGGVPLRGRRRHIASGSPARSWLYRGSGPDHFVLAPPPGGLEGYIGSLPHGRRNKVQRDLRRLSEAGVAITVEPLTLDLIRTVAPLLVNLYTKYEIDEGCDLITARLAVLRKAVKQSTYGVVRAHG